MTEPRVRVSEPAGRARVAKLALLAAATLLLGTTAAIPSVAAEPTQPTQPPQPTANDGAYLLLEPPVASTDETAKTSRTTDVGPQDLPAPWTYYTLQLNLCNSGKAGCYDMNNGQSVPEAIDLIDEVMPDLVTLNEVCYNDVIEDLYPAMQDKWSHEWVFAAFYPAFDPYDDGVWPPDTKKCTNGQEYGSGIIGRAFATINDDPPSAAVWSGIYPEDIQVPNKEWRSWVCVDIQDTQWTCTTHLTSEDALYALEQCHHLMDEVLPGLQDAWGHFPSIVGGDFNLHYPTVQQCVPDGWWRKGDDDVQHVMYTDDFDFTFTEAYEMEHTDHPGWLVAAGTPGTLE